MLVAFHNARGYLWRHLPHLILAPILALTAVTFVHELAHSVAVWAQGGRVTAFSFLPGGGHFGYINYQFDPGAWHHPALISVAPYVLWALVALATSVIALSPRRLPRPLGSILWVWFYVVPLLDIAVHVLDWTFGTTNDLYYAFGEGSPLLLIPLGTIGAVGFIFSFFVQRGLYDEDRALSFPGYALVSLLAVGVLSVLMALLT